MSKFSVYVFSKIPNLAKELQLALPSITVHDVNKASQSALGCQCLSGQDHSQNVNGLENWTLLKEAEIIVGDFTLMAPHIYNLPRLKWLQGTWAGLNKIQPYITKPLPFLLTRYSGRRFGQIMSEYVIAQIVYFERDFHTTESNQKKQIWCQDGQVSEYRVISDLTIGILGLGHIGSCIGRCLTFFGAKVLGYARKPQLDPSIDFITSDCYYNGAALSEFLEKCDYIINILPTTSETIGLLNGDILKSCEAKKPIFINVGRGTIIKEEDLVHAIKSGWISRAILDVFEEEPLPKDSVLWKMKEVVITPHVSCESKAKHIAEFFKDNLPLYLENKPIPTAFNAERGY